VTSLKERKLNRLDNKGGNVTWYVSTSGTTATNKANPLGRLKKRQVFDIEVASHVLDMGPYKHACLEVARFQNPKMCTHRE
jgi:hypothetical protein